MGLFRHPWLLQIVSHEIIEKCTELRRSMISLLYNHWTLIYGHYFSWVELAQLRVTSSTSYFDERQPYKGMNGHWNPSQLPHISGDLPPTANFLGPTLILSAPRWANVGPTCLAIWDISKYARCPSWGQYPYWRLKIRYNVEFKYNKSRTDISISSGRISSMWTTLSAHPEGCTFTPKQNSCYLGPVSI